MKVVLLLILGLFATSCLSYKACSTKFDWKSDTIRTVVYRDTIIPVLIHGNDTVYRKAVITDTILVSSGNAHVRVFTIHDTTRVILWQTDSTVFVKLDSAIMEKTILNKQITTQKEEGQAVKFMAKLLGCLLIIAVIALIIVVIPRLIKRKG